MICMCEYDLDPEDYMGGPPGEFLADLLEEYGMSKMECARRAGRKRNCLSQIYVGALRLTKDVAADLERATGVPTKTWLALEKEYRAQPNRRIN